MGQRKFHPHLILKCRWHVVRCSAAYKMKIQQPTFAWALYQSEGKSKAKFSLEQSTKARRGSRGIALLFL